MKARFSSFGVKGYDLNDCNHAPLMSKSKGQHVDQCFGIQPIIKFAVLIMFEIYFLEIKKLVINFIFKYHCLLALLDRIEKNYLIN